MKNNLPMTKVTFKELKAWLNNINSYVNKHPETKLALAIAETIEPVKDVFDKFNKALGKIQLKHALENSETGAVLYVDKSDQSTRPYRYAKDALQLLEDEEYSLEKEWSKMSFDIEVCTVTEFPKDLPAPLVKAFGFMLEKK